MLKKCYGLFLGLVVLAGSACVTPTHASSASILITQVRAGSQLSASEEAIVLYNNSANQVDVTGWCLSNKTNSPFACFTPASATERYAIPAYSYASIVSSKTVPMTNPDIYSLIYEPSSSSSGSIVASSDTIMLLNAQSTIVDQHAWSSSLSSVQQWSRIKTTLTPVSYVDTDMASDWQKVSFDGVPVSQLVVIEILHEEPPEDPPVGETEGEMDDPNDVDSGQPEVEPGFETPLLPIVITEILPNAIGSDTGNEFIELYNPNETQAISLKGFTLLVGLSLEKKIVLGELTIQPKAYMHFSNAQLGFSLLNTSSRVQLLAADGTIASQVPPYTAPPEGEAWALINTDWLYTNTPTPGEANTQDDDNTEMVISTLKAASVQKPCTANQYRSLETNRCRLISMLAATVPVACKAAQERNLETNRCRAVAKSTATTCKEGQEKNPETNRCRTIKKMTAAPYGVKGVSSQQQSGMGWYMWVAIGGIVLLIIGYGVWEWREELKKLALSTKTWFAGKLN
jgi:hypothetical protein